MISIFVSFLFLSQMDDTLSSLPDELLIHILSLLEDEDLSILISVFPRIKSMAEDSGLWLSIIRYRFNINFSNKKAYALLIKLLNCDLAQKVTVTLIDDENKIAKPLGKILVTAADTLRELVTKIKNKFGLLGWIEFQRLNNPSADNLEDKYGGYFINYDGYNNPYYAQFDFDTLILPDQFSDERYIAELDTWLSNVITEIMPKPLLDDLEIIVHKYSYSDREMKIIETVLNNLHRSCGNSKF